MSLASVADSYDFISASKTHGLDYTEQYLPCTPLDKKSLEYCENDIKVMYQYLLYMREQYNHVVDIPYTQTGRIAEIIKKSVLNDKTHLKHMKEIKPNYDVYRRLTRIFRGGMTGCNWCYIGETIYNCWGGDLSSSYPTVMCLEEFPMGNFEKGTTDFFNKDYRYIYHIKINDLQAETAWGYISIFKSEKVECYEEQIDREGHQHFDCVDGKLQSAKSVELWCTDVDLEIIKLTYKYSTIEFCEYYRSMKGYLPKQLVKYILSIYQEKCALKGDESKSDLYVEIKQRFNSIYGLSVKHLVHDYVDYLGNGIWKTNKLNKDEISDELEKISPFLNYAWGIWITAFARKNLYTVLLAIGNQAFYIDTDSIKFVGKSNFKYMDKYNEMHWKKIEKVCERRGLNPEMFVGVDYNGEKHILGEWEKDKPILKFKSNGSKKYIYEDSKGFHTVIAGCKKKYYDHKLNKEIDTVPHNFENFKNGAEFKNGRTVSWYTINQPLVRLTDYLGNKYLSSQKNGIVTLNTSYTLGMPLNTQEYLKRPHNGLTNYLRTKM